MSAFTGGPDGPISTERYQELLESEKRMNELEAENKALRRTRWGEVWYWQGDSEDHLESLNCPVLIEAETLRKMQRDHRETVRAFIFSEDQKREEIRGLLKEREMLKNRIADFEVGPDGGVAEQLRTHSERCTLGRLQLSAEIYNDVADLIAPHEARWQADRQAWEVERASLLQEIALMEPSRKEYRDAWQADIQATRDLLTVIFRDPGHEAAKRADIQAACLYAQSVVRGYFQEAEEGRQSWESERAELWRKIRVLSDGFAALLVNVPEREKP